MATIQKRQHSCVVYIDSHANVTDVRQVLAHYTATKQMILIIPPQTQIQGVVAWKLLARYAQTLSKTVVIVSRNQHIRNMAHLVGLQTRADAENPEREARRSQRRYSSPDTDTFNDLP